MELRKILSSLNIYHFSVILLAASLPLSVFTTSLAEILLIVNWLREGQFATKWQILKERKSVFFIISIYFLHLAGLLYTQDSNWNYALHDLKIKLPILILPVIFVSSKKFTAGQLRFILMIFSTATIISTLISFLVFLGWIPYEFYDFRDISIFISHIRLALMVNLSVFIIIYYSFNRNPLIRIGNKLRWIYVLFIPWLIFFLVLLKSITGLTILTILILVLAWFYAARIKEVAPRFIIRTMIMVIPLLVASFLTRSIGRFYYTEEIDLANLEKNTPSGNEYSHDTIREARENGHYVWVYLCEKELRQEWNKVSRIAYDSLDMKNQEIKYTLIRYLTSLGERKDSSGVHSLSTDDIRAIENGKANYIFTNKYSLYPRIYEIIWEIDGYRRGGDPSGHSVAQRIMYLDAAKYIIRNNLMFGVGTGDVQKSFNSYYETTGSKLSKDYRRRAHNQYLTFIITFGIVGFIIAMGGIFIPVFLEKKWKDYLFVVFFSIALISLLNEDTLETQTGVSFFMFFYSLLIYSRVKIENNEI